MRIFIIEQSNGALVTVQASSASSAAAAFMVQSLSSGKVAEFFAVYEWNAHAR